MFGRSPQIESHLRLACHEPIVSYCLFVGWQQFSSPPIYDYGGLVGLPGRIEEWSFEIEIGSRWLIFDRPTLCTFRLEGRLECGSDDVISALGLEDAVNTLRKRTKVVPKTHYYIDGPDRTIYIRRGRKREHWCESGYAMHPDEGENPIEEFVCAYVSACQRGLRLLPNGAARR